MKINDELTLKVEKITSEGKGICRHNNFVVFVENACPEDLLKVKITHLTKSFAEGEIVEILKPSKHRIKPMCPLQKVCGSCQIQFIDYDYQIELKKQIVEDTKKKILGDYPLEIQTPIKSPEIKGFRHKVQVPVRETKVSKRLLAGYFKPKSHEIINIKYCPIQTETSDKIIDFIRNEAKNYQIKGYDEGKHSGELKHIVIRSSTLNQYLVTLVLNTKVFGEKYKKFAKALMEKFDVIKGVCININPFKTNIILTEKTICLEGSEYIEEMILDKKFKIGTNTFFQVNPKSAENIFRYVRNYIKTNYQSPTLLDAYAGVGAFGIVMSDVARKVVSIEENKSSVELGKRILKENNIKNMEMHCEDAEKFFKKEKRQFTVTILDPPRKGCTEKSLENALKLTTDKIIYVSCNPATLFRDLKYFIAKGAKVESVQPFDMFVHSYHIENVAIIDVKDVNFSKSY